MKKILFFLLYFLTNITIAQSIDSLKLDNYYQNVISSKPYFDYQNWMDEDRTLPDGIYYKFEGRIRYEDGQKSVELFPVRNPERVFGFLLALGVPLKEAWYRQYESNCRGYEAVVYPSLLIRLERKISNDLIEQLGFRYTENPIVGDCPYNIHHYSFD